jgi:hypothetical protein
MVIKHPGFVEPYLWRICVGILKVFCWNSSEVFWQKYVSQIRCSFELIWLRMKLSKSFPVKFWNISCMISLCGIYFYMKWFLTFWSMCRLLLNSNCALRQYYEFHLIMWKARLFLWAASCDCSLCNGGIIFLKGRKFIILFGWAACFVVFNNYGVLIDQLKEYVQLSFHSA